MEEVNRWGKILAAAENNVKPLPAIDSQIAAAAQVHELSVVRINAQDIECAGVEEIYTTISH